MICAYSVLILCISLFFLYLCFLFNSRQMTTLSEKAILLSMRVVNIGINHGFQCSNIRWITRKVFEHKAAGRVFKHLPSDPANV